MKLFFTLMVMLGLGACAKPRYADSPTGDRPTPAAAPNGGECSLKLKTAGTCLRLAWVRRATSEAPGELLLTAIAPAPGADGIPVTRRIDGEVRVSLWMPSMNHGSTPITVEPVADGVYRVRDVYFIMPGDWEIRVQVWNGSHLIDEGSYALEF